MNYSLIFVESTLPGINLTDFMLFSKLHINSQITTINPTHLNERTKGREMNLGNWWETLERYSLGKDHRSDRYRSVVIKI